MFLLLSLETFETLIDIAIFVFILFLLLIFRGGIFTSLFLASNLTCTMYTFLKFIWCSLCVLHVQIKYRKYFLHPSFFPFSYVLLPVFAHLSSLNLCLYSCLLIPLGSFTVMSLYKPRLALSSVLTDGQLPSPDQLWPFVLWYDIQHTHTHYQSFFFFHVFIHSVIYETGFIHCSFPLTPAHLLHHGFICVLIHSLAHQCALSLEACLFPFQ